MKLCPGVRDGERDLLKLSGLRAAGESPPLKSQEPSARNFAPPSPGPDPPLKLCPTLKLSPLLMCAGRSPASGAALFALFDRRRFFSARLCSAPRIASSRDATSSASMSRAPSGESHETAWVDGCESKSGVERGEPCFRAGLALPVAGANSLLLVRLLAEGIVRVLCLVPSIQ